LAQTGFQKWGVLCCLLFKRELFNRKIFAGFQNRRVGSDRLSKALGAAPRNLISNRSKGFELASFEQLF
jgi:hypothetical protein